MPRGEGRVLCSAFCVQCDRGSKKKGSKINLNNMTKAWRFSPGNSRLRILLKAANLYPRLNMSVTVTVD